MLGSEKPDFLKVSVLLQSHGNTQLNVQDVPSVRAGRTAITAATDNNIARQFSSVQSLSRV